LARPFDDFTSPAARATIGHIAAAPPMRPMNSRRFMPAPKDQTVYLSKLGTWKTSGPVGMKYVWGRCRGPFWVMSGSRIAPRLLPLFPQQRTFRNAAVRSALYQQATSHVWPKMKEAANLGRPRLIDASSLTVLNSEFPLLLQQYCISTHIGTMQRIEKPHTRQLVVLSSMN
jgi:hypothetical protein